MNDDVHEVGELTLSASSRSAVKGVVEDGGNRPSGRRPEAEEKKTTATINGSPARFLRLG